MKLQRRRHAVVGVAMMVLLSCGDGGGGEDDTGDEGEAGRREEGVTTSSTSVVSTTTSSPPTTAPPSTIAVGPTGETVSNGGWALLVHGLTDPYGPASNPSGDRVVLVDVEVTHTGQGSATSLTAFNNFQLTGADLPSPGMDAQGMSSIAGSLTGDASRRGSMAFLVDANVTTGMQLVFRPSLTDDPVVAVQLS